MQQPKIQSDMAKEAVERFVDDCMYIEETHVKGGIPSLVVYIIWLEWMKAIVPDVRLTFSEFNSVLVELMPGYIEFKDTAGIAAWKSVDLTQLAHLYFSSSRLGIVFQSWEENQNDEQ